tara:strand:+ start:2768 stop:3637 length:870 start_codon:yes stop_codon:yes gene_type:complete
MMESKKNSKKHSFNKTGIFNNSESLIVYTHRSRETLLKFNGSTSWKLNPKRAKKCKYIICCQNTDSHLYDPSEDQEFQDDHTKWTYRDKGEAFLVGLISDIVPSMNPRDEGRWMIEFKEYADISVKDFWEGYRNPVIYEDTLKVLDKIDRTFDLDEIKWNIVPTRDESYMQKYFTRENAYYDGVEKISYMQYSFPNQNFDEKNRIAQMEESLKKHNISLDLDGDGIVGLKEGQTPDVLSASEQKEVDSIIEEFSELERIKSGLTIDQAKKGLSKRYDIPEENIQIVLKG